MSFSDLLSISDTLQVQDEKIEKIYRTLDRKFEQLRKTVEDNNIELRMQMSAMSQAISEINQKISPSIIPSCSSQNLPASVSPTFEGDDEKGRKGSPDNG